MKFNSHFVRALTDDKGNIEITLSTRDKAAVDRLKGEKPEQVLTAEIKRFRKARSLDANAYAWKLMGEIALALQTTSDEIYEELLERYGVFDTIPIYAEFLENERKKHRKTIELDRTTLYDKNGIARTFVWVKCYRGSSEYDTAEMAHFIDGIVSEAKELGIETRTPAELAEIKTAWGKENKNDNA